MRRTLITVTLLIIGVALWWWLTPADVDDGSQPLSSPATGDKGAELPSPDDDKPVDDIPQGQLPAVREVPIAGQPSVTDQQQAQDLLDQQELGLGPDSQLQVHNSTSDDYGNSYYQVEQTYKGLPVFGSQALLEVEHGVAQVLNGVWVEQIELDIEPDHPPAEALRLALDRRGVPAEREVSVLGEPRLLVFVTDRGPTLSWRLIATLSTPESTAERYLVDAHNPVIYLQEPVLQR